MSDIVLIAILSLVVIYQDFRATKSNFGAVFNGVGSIPAVLKGESLAPMQYRVLVPWVCKLFGPGEKDTEYLKPYMWLRWAAIVFAISMAHLFYGGNILFLLAFSLFLVVAALYDYTDVYLEVAFFALAFSLLPAGPWWLLMLVTFLAALNRETAVFIPITAFFWGEIWLAGLLFVWFVIGYMIPRLHYGPVDRYCDFNMLGSNVDELVRHYKARPFIYVEYTWFAVLLGLMIYAYATQPLNPVVLSMGLMFVLLLVPTKWREIRVFAPCAMVMIPMVVR